MGRRTWESLPRRPLPDRYNIVIGKHAPGAHRRVDSLEAAIAHSRLVGYAEAVIMGGARLYAEAIPHADRIYLTVVNGIYKADTYFPAHFLLTDDWKWDSDFYGSGWTRYRLERAGRKP